MLFQLSAHRSMWGLLSDACANIYAIQSRSDLEKSSNGISRRILELVCPYAGALRPPDELRATDIMDAAMADTETLFPAQDAWRAAGFVAAIHDAQTDPVQAPTEAARRASLVGRQVGSRQAGTTEQGSEYQSEHDGLLLLVHAIASPLTMQRSQEELGITPWRMQQLLASGKKHMFQGLAVPLLGDGGERAREQVLAAPGIPGRTPNLVQTPVFAGTDTTLGSLTALAAAGRSEVHGVPVPVSSIARGGRGGTGSDSPRRWSVLSYGHSEAMLLGAGHDAGIRDVARAMAPPRAIAGALRVLMGRGAGPGFEGCKTRSICEVLPLVCPALLETGGGSGGGTQGQCPGGLLRLSPAMTMYCGEWTAGAGMGTPAGNLAGYEGLVGAGGWRRWELAMGGMVGGGDGRRGLRDAVALSRRVLGEWDRGQDVAVCGSGRELARLLSIYGGVATPPTAPRGPFVPVGRQLLPSIAALRREAAARLPPLLRGALPEGGGPKLVCLHHRKFEAYAVAFRWEHPAEFTIEAVAVAAADAAPTAFRKAVLGATGIDVAARADGSRPPGWVGSDGSEAGQEHRPELDLGQVVRAFAARPSVAVEVLERMQAEGAVRLVMASLDPEFAREKHPRFQALLHWMPLLLETRALDAMLDLWGLSVCDALVEGASTFSIWASIVGDTAVDATRGRVLGAGRHSGAAGSKVGLGELAVPLRRCGLRPPVSSLSQLEGDGLLGPPGPGCGRFAHEWWHAQRAAWTGPHGVAGQLWAAGSAKEAAGVFYAAAEGYRLAWGGRLGAPEMGPVPYGPYLA